MQKKKKNVNIPNWLDNSEYINKETQKIEYLVNYINYLNLN